MPLKKGSSRKTVSSNIGEMVGAYKEKGKIGTSKPKNKSAAVKQAVAIALSTAGKSNRSSKPKEAKKGGAFMVVKKKDGNRPVEIY
jgi:hypothetical protein